MSKIEWTDTTWNPTAGCAKVSPGCEHCYAMRHAGRLLDGRTHDAMPDSPLRSAR